MAGETSSPMEQFLENPGLVHLAENIFSNLNDADVEICRNINQISLAGEPKILDQRYSVNKEF